MYIKMAMVMSAALVMAGTVLALDNVEVTDVKARQRYPWNGKVDIDFKLDSKPTEPYQMLVEVYDNVGKTNLPVKSVCTENVSVEANPCMVRTDTTRIVWDAAKDLPNGFKCTNVLVTCRDARTIAVSNLYCVIDLTTGAKEYLNGIPAGGWTDEHKTTKMVFRRIEAGSFMMGSSSDEAGRQNNETLHQVTLSKAYYISIYEFTEGQYKTLKGETGESKQPLFIRYGEIRGFDCTWAGGETDYTWPIKASVSSTSLLGVFRDKVKINSLDLPTEAQWEYAARGGSATALYSGLALSDDAVSVVGRYSKNATDGKGDSACVTYTIVGAYLPNAYGLYDVIGNAREWCRDLWQETLSSSATVDPVGSETFASEYVVGGNVTPSNCKAVKRVVKGGGYYYVWSKNSRNGTYEKWDVTEDSACRCAWRGYSFSYPDSTTYSDYNGPLILKEGFRMVFDADE